jgi:hypothetical protein
MADVDRPVGIRQSRSNQNPFITGRWRGSHKQSFVNNSGEAETCADEVSGEARYCSEQPFQEGGLSPARGSPAGA